MSGIFADGRIIDIVFLTIAVEVAVLYYLRKKTGRGPTLAAVAPFLAAGIFLLIGMRIALVGGRWEWIAAALAFSGVAHAIDMWRRFRS